MTYTPEDVNKMRYMVEWEMGRKRVVGGSVVAEPSGDPMLVEARLQTCILAGVSPLSLQEHTDAIARTYLTKSTTDDHA